MYIQVILELLFLAHVVNFTAMIHAINEMLSFSPCLMEIRYSMFLFFLKIFNLRGKTLYPLTLSVPNMQGKMYIERFLNTFYNFMQDLKFLINIYFDVKRYDYIFICFILIFFKYHTACMF